MNEVNTLNKREIIDVLKERTSEKNAIILEKAIAKLFITDEVENYNKEDFHHIYNILGILMDETYTLKETLDQLRSFENKNECINALRGWKMHPYSKLINKREMQNLKDTRPTKISDGIYKCYKCNNKKVVMYSLQLRSADEPMTNFFTCTTCGNKWKG